MNISIDEDVINKTKFHGNTLEPSEFLLCMAIKLDNNIIKSIESLIERNVLVRDIYDDNKIYLRSDCYNALQQVLLESDKVVPKISDIEELTLKLQELFPKERKPDKNGIPKYAYRGNKTDVAKRLQKFFKLYGQYSYEDVLECTKRYVERFKYDKTHMRILPYFIMKDEESDLATELDNMEDEPQDFNNPNEDWTNTLL